MERKYQGGKGPDAKWKARPDLNAPGTFNVQGVSVDRNGRVGGLNGADMDPIGRRPVSPRSTRKSARNGNMR